MDTLSFFIVWLFVAIVVGFLLWAILWTVCALANAVAGILGRPWGEAAGGPASGHVRPRIPPAVRRQVLKRDGYVCQECGSTENLVMDHVIALSRGGATTLENLEVLCNSCNEKKGARP